jgi:hypothetical protein
MKFDPSDNEQEKHYDAGECRTLIGLIYLVRIVREADLIAKHVYKPEIPLDSLPFRKHLILLVCDLTY